MKLRSLALLLLIVFQANSMQTILRFRQNIFNAVKTFHPMGFFNTGANINSPFYSQAKNSFPFRPNNTLALGVHSVKFGDLERLHVDHNYKDNWQQTFQTNRPWLYLAIPVIAHVAEKNKEQAQVRGRKASTIIPADTLTILSSIVYTGVPLMVPRDILFDAEGNLVNLEELFKKYGITIPEHWSVERIERNWEYITKSLIESLDCPKIHNQISIDELPSLVVDAKTLLKSFLLTDEDQIAFIEGQKPIKEIASGRYEVIANVFKEPISNALIKGGYNRLFAYAKMEQVINDEKLTNVHLPRKVLIIQDVVTGKYLSSEEAAKVIDTTLEVAIRGVSPLEIRFDFDSSWNYDFIILAEEQVRSRVRLSLAAREDLKKLCEKAPFDIGYGNIFTNSNGEAVIVDTENKGESSKSCIQKLARYY